MFLIDYSRSSAAVLLLIKHVNVKTLNGSEHDGRSFFSFFYWNWKILEAKVKFWCDTHMTQLFLKKFLIFTKFRRERTVFHFIFKENGKSEAVFPQVLEDRTLSGTPQCFSYFITIKKNVFLDVDSKHMY